MGIYRTSDDEILYENRGSHRPVGLRESRYGTKVLTLATLAHELRYPLADIQSAIRVLQDRAGAAQTRSAARTLIARRSSQLLRLIDDLLTLGSVTAGTLEVRKQRVELKSILAMAVESSAPAISACAHRFQVRLPRRRVFVDADPLRLAQVLVNLLDNAAKYSAPWGQVTVSVARSDGEVTIRVQDDGIGIVPERLAVIFGPFVQGGSTLTGERRGLGIGLHLVKRIVELHDGRVEAYSKGLGCGSVFTVCLPEAVDTDPRRASVVPMAAWPRHERPMRRAGGAPHARGGGGAD